MFAFPRIVCYFSPASCFRSIDGSPVVLRSYDKCTASNALATDVHDDDDHWQGKERHNETKFLLQS